MTEPLGQAQVLPYLRGLARRGVRVDIVCYEPEGTPAEEIAREREALAACNMGYFPLVRSKKHDLATKVIEAVRGVLKGSTRAIGARPDIVHARSYLPTAVADVLATLLPGARLLFDCRGMLGDEAVDAGVWTRDRLEYRLVKRYERRAFRRAEGVVVLTRALERWLEQEKMIGESTHVAVIPCCVDLAKFHIDADVRTRARRALGLDNKLVLTYSGGLGSWYLEEEMARFAGMVRRKRADAVALVLSPSDTTRFRNALAAQGFEDHAIRVLKIPPRQMPETLIAGDIGLSFIKSCFSKMGSSPTKVAEYLAAGLPVVLNGDIGDQAELADASDACVVLRSFADEELAGAATRAVALATRPYETRAQATRAVALARFDLEAVGVPRYEALYQAMLGAAPSVADWIRGANHQNRP